MSYILIFAINRHTKITNRRTLTMVSVISEKPIIKRRTIYHKLLSLENQSSLNGVPYMNRIIVHRFVLYLNICH